MTDAEDLEMKRRLAVASGDFQTAGLQRVAGYWVSTRFGREVLDDIEERGARVFEEGAELAQATGLSEEKAARILARVYSRPAGDPSQEAAGVAVTLLAWAAAAHRNLSALVRDEMTRILALPAEHFRRKQTAKAEDGTAAFPATESAGYEKFDLGAGFAHCKCPHCQAFLDAGGGGDSRVGNAGTAGAAIEMADTAPAGAAGARRHRLKTDPVHFSEVSAGRKTAELRLNDRDFRVGDIIELVEFDRTTQAHTGAAVVRKVTHILTDKEGPWLAPGYCMLSLAE